MLETVEVSRKELRRELGLFDLILLNIGAVVGVRWPAIAAHLGPGSLCLWVLAALFFFVPSGLVVAGLSRKYPEEGGLYIWTREAFGAWHGFLCGACYFLSDLFFFPAILVSGFTVAAAGLGFQQDKHWITGMALAVLWIATGAHLAGLAVGKWVNDVGGLAIFLIGMLLMLFGAQAWIHSGAASRFDRLLPPFDPGKLSFWSQITLGFTGLELGAIMGGEIRNPVRNIPRAAWISGTAICLFYIGGTLGILILIPARSVDIMTGVIQAGQRAGALLGWESIPLILALLYMLATAGSLSSYLSGASRLPFVIGRDGYLPPVFARLHSRWGTPYLAIIGQGLFGTAVLLISMYGETLRTGFQLLVDMTAITTLFPFLYLFASAWKHGLRMSAFSGLAVTALALVLAFAPPEGTSWVYEAKLVGGCAMVVLAARMNFQYALSRK